MRQEQIRKVTSRRTRRVEEPAQVLTPSAPVNAETDELLERIDRVLEAA